jgi:hypothetical protein
MKKQYVILICISLMIVSIVRSEVVCSESELIKELQEDIADNGKLDCLRETIAEEGETLDQRAKRIKANWTGDCSFESNNQLFPWTKRLLNNYPLIRGLVDVMGEPIDKNEPEQADMCEIIRTLIGNDLFKDVKLIGDSLISISDTLVNYIDCPNEICAATGSSFADEEGWYIFLDGQSIQFNGKPQYKPTASK